MKNELVGLLLSLAAFMTLATSNQPSPSPSPVQATITVPRGTMVAVLVTKDIRIGGFGNSTEAKRSSSRSPRMSWSTVIWCFKLGT